VVEHARKHNCPIIGEVELLQQQCPKATYVGITGTNGKSTTTALIGHILEMAGKNVQVGGNLGVPALALEPLGKDGIYVLEMSSYQLDLLDKTRFDVALLLNITPDHLDRHGTMENYIAAKMRIFEGATHQIRGVSLEHSPEKSSLPGLSGQSIEADMDHPNKSGGDGGGVGELLPLPPTLAGTHNLQNAMAAQAACQTLGVADEIITQATQTFPGLPHRMQWLGEIEGVTFVNDSKATNAEATANALRTYDDIYWILGGKAKAGGIESLEPFFSKICGAYLIGEAQEEFAKTLELHKVPHQRCNILGAAFTQATTQALQAKKGVVLLSPACASFDQFPNFMVRGEAFCQLVEEKRRGSNAA
jgi:UDP-N-acetylmuramoylalanine--D-glutamate ligase